jgi:hypothetical protein
MVGVKDCAAGASSVVVVQVATGGSVRFAAVEGKLMVTATCGMMFTETYVLMFKPAQSGPMAGFRPESPPGSSTTCGRLTL